MTGPSPDAHPVQGWLVVLVGVVLAVTATGWWLGAKPAGYLLAACFAGLGLARLIAPADRLGPLVVRSKGLDAALGLGFAVTLAIVTYALPSYP